jgi:hypothetical protein
MSVTALFNQLLAQEAECLARTEALLSDVRASIAKVEAEIQRDATDLMECDE